MEGRAKATADEADIDPFGGHQCACSTISVSTLPVERGWTKATRLLRMPTRGWFVINSGIRAQPGRFHAVEQFVGPRLVTLAHNLEVQLGLR